MISEIEVRGKNTVSTVKLDPRVFHMNVEDPVSKFVDEEDRINELMHEVTGIKIEAEVWMMTNRLQSPVGRNNVVSNLCWVYLQTKFNPLRLENIQNGSPAIGKILIACVDIGLAGGWEEIEFAPYTAASEAVDDPYAKPLGGSRCILHFFSAALSDPFRGAVTPDP